MAVDSPRGLGPGPDSPPQSLRQTEALGQQQQPQCWTHGTLKTNNYIFVSKDIHSITFLK